MEEAKTVELLGYLFAHLYRRKLQDAQSKNLFCYKEIPNFFNIDILEPSSFSCISTVLAY